MDNWVEVAQIIPPPGADGLPTPITTLAFDPLQELLWTGHRNGRVTSFTFLNGDMTLYTSFMAHATADGPVHQLLFSDKGVYALGSSNLHMALRRGLPLGNLNGPDIKGMLCMSFTSKGTSELLLAGDNSHLVVIDLSKNEVSKKIPTERHYVQLNQASRYLIAATKSGTIDLLDPQTFQVTKSWVAYTSMYSDIDVNNNFIVTCGYTLRNDTNYMLETLVKLYDLKKGAAMNPFPFHPGAAHIRLNGAFDSFAVVASQRGTMHFVDILEPNNVILKQANVTTVSRIAISPSSRALAVVDEDLRIQLWGSPTEPIHFSALGQVVEWPDPVHEAPYYDINSDVSFSQFGLPYYREELLSAWPPGLLHHVGMPAARFDAEFLSTLTQAEFGQYGPNVRSVLRNQVEGSQLPGSSQAVSGDMPRFLSEQARESASTLLARPGDVAPRNSGTVTPVPAASVDPYRRVEIKYSKFGIDDFDFKFFNKTEYSGLTNHISNSYANPLLQLMRFTPMVRNLALQHAASACINDSCLLCEMGYLFDMLEKANGSICHPTNFLRTLVHHPQAAPMGLAEESSDKMTEPGDLLQRLTRFLLDKMVTEFRSASPVPGTMEQALATKATSFIRCTNCKQEYARAGTVYVNELMYPNPKPAARNQGATRTTFSQVLKMSVERETTSKGWCAGCKRYHPINTRKTIESPPEVFVLNAVVNTPERRRLWATPGWLPSEIGVIVDDGRFFCYEGDDLKFHLEKKTHRVIVYSLVGVAASVCGTQHQKPHLIATVNVSHSNTKPPQRNEWVLLNDFLIQPIDESEALSFNQSSKTPCVITFQVKTANNVIDEEWKTNLDTSILFHDDFSGLEDKTYRPLDPKTEQPTKGTIVVLDSEFVSIKEKGLDMASADAKEEIQKPASHAIARVSIVRGTGPTAGDEAFIDDYILVKEKVVNYLTEFSGIRADDLDPRRTRRHLVPLKVAYKKTWILLNLGCVFLGHGLQGDFRELNIFVPREQIIDTYDLFYDKKWLRRFSLAFLGWYFFKERIQKDTHDSIEDARTTYKLYCKYLEFKEAGVLVETINALYREGKMLNYKVPVTSADNNTRSGTPPPGAPGIPPATPVRNGGAGSGAIASTPSGSVGPITPVRNLGISPESTGGSNIDHNFGGFIHGTYGGQQQPWTSPGQRYLY